MSELRGSLRREPSPYSGQFSGSSSGARFFRIVLRRASAGTHVARFLWVVSRARRRGRRRRRRQGEKGKEEEEEEAEGDCSVVQMPLRVGITLLIRMGHKGSPTLDVGARCEGWDCKPSGPRAGARTDGGPGAGG